MSGLLILDGFPVTNAAGEESRGRGISLDGTRVLANGTSVTPAARQVLVLSVLGANLTGFEPAGK